MSEEEIWVRKRAYHRGPEYTVRSTAPTKDPAGYFQVVPKQRLDEAMRLLQEAFDSLNEWQNLIPEGVALEFSEKALKSGLVKEKSHD